MGSAEDRVKQLLSNQIPYNAVRIPITSSQKPVSIWSKSCVVLGSTPCAPCAQQQQCFCSGWLGMGGRIFVTQPYLLQVLGPYSEEITKAVMVFREKSKSIPEFRAHFPEAIPLGERKWGRTKYRRIPESESDRKGRVPRCSLPRKTPLKQKI